MTRPSLSRRLRSWTPLALVASAAMPFACAFDPHGTAGEEGGGAVTTTTTSSSTTTTASTACEPGMTKPCYNGPPGTDGKGPCQGGTQECKGDGSGYGPCEGEVLPKLEESCETPEDDNCNGVTNEGCDCEPGAMQDCYTGPGGTKGVGICKGGQQECGADHKWGMCKGETLPEATENCATPEDENCNGLVYDDTAAGCVCEPGKASPCDTGKVGLCAAGTHTCDITGKDFTACMDTYTAKFDDCTTPEDDDCSGTAISACTGGPTASTAIAATTNDDQAFALAVASNGELVVGGVANGTVVGFDVSAGSLLIEKRAADGSSAWKKTINPGNNNYAVARGAGLDNAGNVYVVGHFKGTLDLGPGASITSNMGGSDVDVFLAKLDAGGTAQWIKRYGNGGNPQSGYAIAVDGAGNSYITGAYAGGMDLGSGCNIGNSAGLSDVFVAKVDNGGTCKWAKRFGDGSNQEGRGIAVTPGGETVYVTGFFTGAIDFGGGGLNSAGGEDVFVAKLAGADGAHGWSKRFGDQRDQEGSGVAIDPQGNAVVTGSFAGNIDLGGGALISGSNFATDVYLAKFAADGTHQWSKDFGDNGETQYVSRVAIDGAGNIALAGWFFGVVDFGGGNLTNADGTNNNADIYVAKFKPDSSHLWSARYGDNAEQRARDVGVDGQGNVYVAGGTQGTTNFGNGGNVVSAGGYDAYLLKLSP